MPAGRGAARRGQAPAISAAILTFAVLALAVALYAYFTGQLAATGQATALLDHLAWVSGNLDVYVNSYSSNSTGTYWLYCYSISIYNAAGGETGFYLTLVPGERVGPEAVFLTPAAYRVPLDRTLTPPVQTGYMYYLYDIDRDGFTEIVGVTGGARIALAGDPPLPTCYDIHVNATIKAYDIPYIEANASRFYLVVGDQDFQSKALTQLNVTIDTVPLWPFSVPGQGKLNVFVFVESPIRLDSLLLAVVTVFNEEYYAALLVPLPTG